jgi:hypothetical protein
VPGRRRNRPRPLPTRAVGVAHHGFDLGAERLLVEGEGLAGVAAEAQAGGMVAYKDDDAVTIISRQGKDHTSRFLDLAKALA